jgi:hypothetical protein
MKTYGAKIWCAFPGCHAEPWPDDPTTTRESFDLLCIDGEWRCEKHRLPKEKHASRIVAASPLAALSEFERLLETGARLEAVLTSRDGKDAFDAYRRELKRGFASLKKAIAPPEPPDGEAKPARQKPISKGKLSEQQGDWLYEKETAETS